MSARVLVAGIGNIFHGDDGFGVRIAQQLAMTGAPEDVRVMDAGIRSIDLVFALLDPYELVILVDATQRGGSPGTLYTIEIRPEDIPDGFEEYGLVNSHGLDPARVLALAKTMGAKLGRILLVACEPQILEGAQTGYIGLSDAVEAAVSPALEIIRDLVQDSFAETVTGRGGSL
jgi:hydrogenase maturation protease